MLVAFLALLSVASAQAATIVWVSFHGADDAPSAGAAGAGFTTAPDKGYTDLLAANGYNVTRYITTGTPDPAVLNAADLVIISRSAASSQYQNASASLWNNISAPMIILNGYTLQYSRMGYTTGNTMVDVTGDITLTVNDPIHPIFAGIPLTDGTMTNPYAGLAVYPEGIKYNDGSPAPPGTLAKGISINTDSVNANGTILATTSAAGNGPVGGMVIAEWQAGAALTHPDGMGGAVTDTLAGHRLVFLTGSREAQGIHTQTAGMYDLYADGEQMFLNAVDYMLGTAPPSLVGWWKFDGDYLDYSGLGNDGTAGGNPTFVAGKIGSGAINLDGDDYVVIDGVDDDVTSSNLTLSAWIKTTQTSEGVVFGTNDNGSWHPLLFGVQDGKAFREDGDSVNYPPAVNDNEWHMLTFVRSGTTGYIYVDAVQRATYTSVFDLSQITRWSIGQEWDASSSNFFNGAVDDARIYNRALTASEIAAVMHEAPNIATNPSPPDGATLVATDVTLSWTAGVGAISHHIYFGTNQADVATGTPSTDMGTQLGTSYDPGALAYGTTYYWRIDEFDGATTHTGNVWSFATAEVVPVAWWKLDETSGTMVEDSSGNGNNGFCEGAVTWVSGQIDGAWQADGISSRIRIPHSESLNISDAVTVTMWVNTTTPGGNRQLIEKGGTSGSAWYSSYGFRMETDRRIRIQWNNTPSYSTSSIPSGEWTHVAVTFDLNAGPNNRKIYFNGNLDAENTYSRPLTTNTFDVVIGCDLYGGNFRWGYKGKLDDIRIYNYALTASEIAIVMKGGPKATNPNPADGATLVATDVTLTWEPGQYAATHDVYLGTVFDDVVQARRWNDPHSVLVSQNQVANTYDPVLEYGQTYYWRIDEVNAPPDSTIFMGNIWSFTTTGIDAPPISIPTDTSIGTWDSDNRIYTLTQDVPQCIQIDEDDLILDGAGHKVVGPGSGVGVSLSGRTGVTVKNLKVMSFLQGIYLWSCSNCTMTSNNSSDNAISGITLWESNNNNNLISNTCNSNNKGPYNVGDGILLAFSSGNILSNNVCNSNHTGIAFMQSEHNTLTGNTASGNSWGIWFYSGSFSGSNNNNLTGNTCNSNDTGGIGLATGDNNTFSNNSCNLNASIGIHVSFCTNNNLSDNTCNYNNSIGIQVWNANYNTLTGNIASNNSRGISLTDAGNNNTIVGNTVSNNSRGIQLTNSSHNQIYNNNFIGNSTQARVDGSSSGNVFNMDKPTGGNFWSNWTTPDADHDCFVDIPYTFTVGQDNYPWVLQDGWLISTDSDGVTDAIENAAPNNGDGNNDGTPDSQQDNVTSLPKAVGEGYVTIVSPIGTSLEDVSAIDNPSPGDTPTGVEFPVGFFNFTVCDLADGSATVTLLLPAGHTVGTYYKYGPEPGPGNETPHWYEFLWDGTPTGTGAEILPDRIILHFVDGQRGDDQDDYLTPDGRIVEPGAPAAIQVVGIDIKPGSYPNSFNNDGHGVIPVAILGSASFNVSQIDVSTLRLAGLALRMKGNGAYQFSIKDVSGNFSNTMNGEPDGYPDLVCQFVDQDGVWKQGESIATVRGKLSGGAPFMGTDSIKITQ